MSIVSGWHRRFGRTRSSECVFRTSGFPAARHAAEPDLFCRQAAMPNHDQARLEAARIGVIGCGGLGSWIGLGLARMGARTLTFVDPDRFDRSNAPRQFMFVDDLGEPKARALARNVLPHMTNAGTARSLNCSFDVALAELTGHVTALAVGVDNNAVRLAAAKFGIDQQCPVVFVMLSRDGERAQVFLQQPSGPCLRCVLPNIDPEAAAPCAAASIASCGLAAAHAVDLLVSSIMESSSTPTWRETSLDGTTERALSPPRNPRCRHCSSPLGP